jgi:hypothetical protein
LPPESSEILSSSAFDCEAIRPRFDSDEETGFWAGEIVRHVSRLLIAGWVPIHYTIGGQLPASSCVQAVAASAVTAIAIQLDRPAASHPRKGKPAESAGAQSYRAGRGDFVAPGSLAAERGDVALVSVQAATSVICLFMATWEMLGASN